MKTAALLACAALTATTWLACSCGRERPAPVPRPKAYPRAALYEGAYVPVTVDGFEDDTLQLNACAQVSRPRPGWLDARYPAYGITLNCTMTHPAGAGAMESALANRAERMALNVGGEDAVMQSFTSRSGRYVTVLTSARALRTPVQFIATDSVGFLFTGSAVGDFSAGTDADSVAPVIKAVEADIIHMLKEL